MPNKRPAESAQHTPLLPGGCIASKVGLVFSVIEVFLFLFFFFSFCTRERLKVETRLCRAAVQRGRGCRGLRAAGSSPGARPAGAAGRGGGAPRRELCCGNRSGAAAAGPVRGSRAEEAGVGSPAFPGTRRGGELVVCRGALRSCRRGFPRYCGVPPRPFQKPNRERSSASDKAFRRARVRAANLSPLGGEEPLRARDPAGIGLAEQPIPRPAEFPRSSEAPPDQPPGTSTFLAPGRGRRVEGVPCFE